MAKDHWDAYEAPDTLEQCVKALLDILDSTEENAEGHPFHPTYIATIRTWDSHRLSKILPKMKELAHAEETVWV